MLLDASWGARGGVAAAAYEEQRQHLLLALQRSASTAVEHYEPDAAAARLVRAAQAALAQTALLQVGAVGLAGGVAVKAAALADLSGLVPAALLAVTGVAVLPMQRHRLQRELRSRVEELSSQLDHSLQSHLRSELHSAASRSAELIAPIAALAESGRMAHAEREAALRASREELDAISHELRAFSDGDTDDEDDARPTGSAAAGGG